MNEIEYGTEFLDQLKDSVHDLYEENIKLKSRNKSLSAENSYYKNIINELEKWLKENSKELQFECSRYYKEVLDKLKKMKEGK